jgi:hypothetical protein
MSNRRVITFVSDRVGEINSEINAYQKRYNLKPLKCSSSANMGQLIVTVIFKEMITNEV